MPSSIDGPTKDKTESIVVGSPKSVHSSSIGGGESDASASTVTTLPERVPMAPCPRLCWAGGKRSGSSGQRPVQLVVRLKYVRRVEMFADYTPSITLAFFPERFVRKLRAITLFFVLHRGILQVLLQVPRLERRRLVYRPSKSHFFLKCSTQPTFSNQ